MTHDRDRTIGLDAFFEAARAQDSGADPDFLARLQADALREMPVAQPRTRPGLLSEIWRAIGGWPAVAGLTAAAVTGLWVGMSPPEVVSDLWTASVSLEYVDPAGSFDFAMVEG
ncbi:hypothetical protein [Puniceibacterium sp. IMCC21224]|uniref:hypothetical protein n=1 Tax=Puniceibacterium sp. IMCC21224 TaxID=1618204 RepID=UPI00064DAA11|nr:hypothetical protein [Puniceibacterium sp. IMCC21224]KMK68102.1 hypothetical protein IMCC21224_112982 [Puniceibacterium sp. IMCC21224]